MAAVATTGTVNTIKQRGSYQGGVAGIGRGIALVQGADDNHLIPAGAGAAAFAIAQESTISVGDPLNVVMLGEATALAGAAVVAGQLLITDATGRLIPTAAAGDNIVGRALSSAAVANDELVVFVLPFVR